MAAVFKSKETKGALVGVLFVVFAIVVTWIAKKQFEIDQEAILMSFIFLPTIIYLIVAEKIQELKGPGGFEAKIAATGSSSIIPESSPITLSIDDMAVVQKDAIGVLGRVKSQLESSQPRPISLELILGEQRYKSDELLEYVRLLSQFPLFKFVVFLDANHKFVAYMQSWAFRNIMTNIQTVDLFVDGIRRGDLNALRQFPGFSEQPLPIKATHVEALQEMLDQNLEAIIVVDKERNVVGVVERDYILSRMMLDITATK